MWTHTRFLLHNTALCTLWQNRLLIKINLAWFVFIKQNGQSFVICYLKYEWSIASLLKKQYFMDFVQQGPQWIIIGVYLTVSVCPTNSIISHIIDHLESFRPFGLNRPRCTCLQWLGHAWPTTVVYTLNIPIQLYTAKFDQFFIQY